MLEVYGNHLGMVEHIIFNNNLRYDWISKCFSWFKH